MNKYEYKFFKASESEQAELWRKQKFTEGYRFARTQQEIFGPNKGEARVIVSKEDLPDSEYDRIFAENDLIKGFDDLSDNEEENDDGELNLGDFLSMLAGGQVQFGDGDDSEDDDDFDDEDDDEEGGSFSLGLGFGSDGSITPMQSDGNSLSFSFTVDEDGEEVPTIQCPRCSKTDVEPIDFESDMHKCNNCGFEFVPEIYKVLESAKEYVGRADWNFQQENNKRAIKDARAAIKLDPNMRKAHLMLGRAHEARVELKEAEAAYSEAIRISPDYDVAYYQRGIVRLGLEKYDEAIEDFTASINLDPDFAQTYFLRAGAYFQKDAFLQAISDYSEAIKRDPQQAVAFFQRGYSYTMIGEDDKALADYSKAIELDPTEMDPHYRRAELHERHARLAEAITDYKNYLRAGGKHTTEADEINEKIITFQKQLDPKFESSSTNLEEENSIWSDITQSDERKKFLSEERSNELLEQGDLDGAYREISDFIRHVPTNVAAYIRRAYVNYESDNLDGVIDDFTGAINCGASISPSTSPFADYVDPRYDQIHLLRALALALAGKEYQMLPDLVGDYKVSLENNIVDLSGPEVLSISQRTAML